MKEVLIERSTSVAIVDDEDFERVAAHKWYINPDCYVFGYPGPNEPRYLHRFILGVKDRWVFVDHRDDNKLNNQKSNLRRCSNKQNVSRKRKMSGFTSRFKGVSWEKRVRKWRATIVHNFKQVHIGTFQSEEEAARRYDQKATELFGEFARLNFEDQPCQI